MQLRTLTVAVLALMVPALSASAETVDPAQVIAQKFSEASEPKPTVTPATKSERPSLDYEMDMLRQARAEELEREEQSLPKVMSQVVAPAPPAKMPPPPPTVAAPPSPSSKPAVATITPAPPTNPPQPAPHADIVPATDNAPRATVLVVLDADADAGAAHIKPDPIICFDQRCWLSNGLEAPARPMARSEAVALKSTDAATADSCSGKSACAFRNIAVSPNAQIQVVEVGESGGVTGSSYTVAIDTSCRKAGGELVCDNALVTQDFRVWVVPEATAQAIGAAALEDAVAAGLPDSDAQSTNDK